MSRKRSYQQVCPVSYALDLVGERWTLLIVRELMHGPRRFTDLQRGLPGIGPNLLSQRLQQLGELAVVQTRRLPPPAASTVYELGEEGKALLPVLMALGRFGLRHIPLPPPVEDAVTANSVIGGLRTFFHGERVGAGAMVVEFWFAQEVVTAAVVGEELAVGHGVAEGGADVVLAGEGRTFFLLLMGAVTWADVGETVVVERGETGDVVMFLSWFGEV